VKVNVTFGALAPSLAKQLNRKPNEVKALQQDADAICRLLVRGLIGADVGLSARRRLMRMILRQAAGAGPLSPQEEK
jgi:hypothetical protein